MSKYSSFHFKSYSFSKDSKVAEFNYSFDNNIFFSEKYIFDFDFVNYNDQALKKALENLFIMAGVSYYKAYLPDKIVIEPFNISRKRADFFSETYQKGLRELLFVNSLAVTKKVRFPFSETTEELADQTESDGKLVAIGGGKDSILSAELLKEQAGKKLATWSVGHRQQLEPLVNTLGFEHFFVERQIDPKLFDLETAYKGHIPVSAIFACTGAVLSVLTGYRDTVVSNEQSANEPTLIKNGEAINHQYSKSSEFELNYQNLLATCFGGALRYYSLLRPLNELQITKLFAEKHLAKYKGAFCSCNKAFRQSENKMSWCGMCPKCCFVFLAMTPFTKKEELVKIFGSNPLTNLDNISVFKELLGQTSNKPFDCVGTINECQWAINKAYKIYPELENIYGKFNCELDMQLTATSLVPKDAQVTFSGLG